MLKRLILRAFNKLGYQLVRLTPPGPESPMHAIPDASCYRPFFNPWLCDSEFNDVFHEDVIGRQEPVASIAAQNRFPAESE